MADAIEWRDGQLIMTPEERLFWYRKFGSSELVDLACIHTAACCIPQPNSMWPYMARARAHLARLAMDKAERDLRAKNRITGNYHAKIYGFDPPRRP